MGIFSDNLQEEVRLEYLRPEQIEAAKRRQPAIYVPFGAIEWHGYHNVVGLDALKAHEQLTGLAVQIGGLVYPPVYFGAGGGHKEWPSTFMVGWEPMVPLVTDLLHGFERDGYQKCILLSGHYPNRNAYLDAAVAGYLGSGGRMQVLALIENQVPGVGGDHGAKHETSSMMYLAPKTVDLSRIQAAPQNEVGSPEEQINWMGAEYREHPCYGLVGIDPRLHANIETGRVNTEALLHFLQGWVVGTGAASASLPLL